MAIKGDKKILFKVLLPQSLRIELNEAEEGGLGKNHRHTLLFARGNP